MRRLGRLAAASARQSDVLNVPRHVATPPFFLLGASRALSEFIPPKPKPHARKLNPLMRILKVRHSSISVLYERSYSMHVGEVWTPPRKTYFLNQPDLVNRVLVKENDRYPKSISNGTLLELLMGDGIFVSNGELWRKHRRMLNPAFEQGRIRDVFPLMFTATQEMARRLRTHGDGEVVAVDEETTHVTADIIFRTIFSQPLESEEAGKIFRAFARFQELIFAQSIWNMAGVPGWLLPGRFFAYRHAKLIRRSLERRIDERLDEIRSGARHEYKDILTSLLEAKDPESGETFNRRDLVNQVSALFLAGHETSASALAWALYLIAKQPEIQERMHVEAVAVFGDREPEYGDLKKLRLARDVFRETLRLYPPVAVMSRQATEPARFRDKVVSPGELVFVAPWLIQRHTKLWDRPDVFDPDRFSDPASKESQRSAYLPFSAGPRVCLGVSFGMQEGTLILAWLARHFRFEPVEGHTPRPIARLTLRSENGIRLRVHKRAEVAPPLHGSQEEAGAGETGKESAAAGCPFH
jgi:cytochrome P450